MVTGNDFVLKSMKHKHEPFYDKVTITFGPNYTSNAYSKEWVEKNGTDKRPPFTMMVEYVDPDTDTRSTGWLVLSDEQMLEFFAHYVSVRTDLAEFGHYLEGEKK